MCLISNNRFPSRAKKDIVCYKILVRKHGSWYTPCRNTPMEIGKLHKAKGSSFSLFKNKKKGRGYIHACLLVPLFLGADDSAFRAIIPKGTKMHIGRKGDICAKEMYISKTKVRINYEGDKTL